MKEKISEYMNINRIEFIITYECGGRCKHCQVGSEINKNLDKAGSHRHVIAEHAAAAVEKLASVFDIESVMTFGGEPLLYVDVVSQIHRKAADCGIKTRQLITNGYFTKSAEKCKQTVYSLYDAGVNNLLLSVDGLHQETIPIEPVYRFAADVAEAKIPNAFLYPAWVVDENQSNPYNDKTKEVLRKFSDVALPVKNNIIDLNGYAAIYLAEYYVDAEPLSRADPSLSAPCSGPADVRSISIIPNGDVESCGGVIGNIYKEDIIDIVCRYNPYENECMSALMAGGIAQLLSYAEKRGITFNISKYYSGCWEACKALIECLAAKTS